MIALSFYIVCFRLSSRKEKNGARRHLRIRRREKNVLDILSPKTLSSVNLRDLESKFGGSFSE